MKTEVQCNACGMIYDAVEFTPPRPAPPCSDHDSPRFSDPGDDGEIDLPDACERCGQAFDLDAELSNALAHVEFEDDGPDPDRLRDEMLDRQWEREDRARRGEREWED